MPTDQDDSKPTPLPSDTPVILLAVGGLLILFTAMLTARILWEETSLTWQQGPQMIGFSLAHGYGAVLFLAPVLLAGWILAMAFRLGWCLFKRKEISRITWAITSTAIFLLALVSIPPQYWQWQFPGYFAHSPHAAELLNYAAVQGQASTARRLIARGVPITSTDFYGNTPIHSAAASGNLDLLTLVVGLGGDVNALNLSGDSPLEVAIRSHHDAAAQFLQQHGAYRITGTPEQHQKAIEQVVREHMLS